MEESLEVTNIKNEPTDSTANKTEKINSVKQERNCSVHSEFCIKSELQEDEYEFPIITGTSYETCPYDDINIKFETEERLTKIECENIVDELIDPLNVNGEIKDLESLIDLDQGRSQIKTEPTDRKNKKKFLESDDDLHGSEFNQDQELLMRKDPNRKDKKYVCSECNKKFNKKSDFDRHLRIHTGERPFSCDVCDRSFNQKGTLVTHMLVHSGEKPYFCDICKKVFNRKGNLDSHKLIHSNEKLFACNVCDIAFKQKQHLVRHKRIHTGVKPYVCDICKKAFPRKSVLTNHRRIHTGERPYSCDICNKLFTHKSVLVKHKKIHKN